MTIIPFQDVDFLDTEELSTESSLDKRDSLKNSPYSENGNLGLFQEMQDIFARIIDRGTVCREDAITIENLSQENSILRTHVRRYPSAMYTQDPSRTLYDETVASLESSVVKSMSETLSTVTGFIGQHGGAAISYIKEVFDEDAKTNASIRKSAHLINFLDKSIKLLEKADNARKFKSDLSHVDGIIYEKYTDKWNGLKDAISQPSKDMAILSESIAVPVIEIYPSVMSTIKKLIEDVSSATDKNAVDKILKNYKSPEVNITKLSKWVAKHVPQGKTVKTEGIVTPIQAMAMTVRTHVKSLENDRNVRVSFKPKDVLDNISKTEWVTTEAVADEILKKAQDVSRDQERLGSEMARLAKSTVVDNEVTQTLIPVVLELLSIVRGFGALIDAIGVITIVKRNLVNEQLQALSEGVKAVHEIVRNKRVDLTVGEVTELNKLITELKSNM